ncbi:MAG TPA: hypothetical protein VE270_05730, partial [Thermoleophilaceae bacterium]|nr:hypothetical protein [Thermoleophilaceae bacterium]
EFPSDTLSTHGLWPNAIARLEALGALQVVRARQRLHSCELRRRAFAHEFSGAFTPVGGHRLCMAPRRVALDAALVDTALGAGADALPRREFAEPLYAGLAHDEPAAQDLRDVFTRRVDPRSGLFTAERRERWFAAAA